MNAATAALVEGILGGSRNSLSKAITLLESSRKQDVDQMILLLDSVYTHLAKPLKSRARISQSTKDAEKPHFDFRNNYFRIGVSGPPGAGKSTFLDSFGCFLLDKYPELRLAILAIDPSSQRTGGSILGDKSRMFGLTAHDRAFIRPSPARGFLGGVAATTNEALVLCRAAGYNLLFVETVGVGQSETLVADLTDMFLLLVPPGGGDELQVLFLLSGDKHV